MSVDHPRLDGQVTHSAILKIARLACDDPVALEKWGIISCHLVRRQASLHDLRHCKTPEVRVLKTLQLWKSENGPAATFERLNTVLRDDFHLDFLTCRIYEYLNSVGHIQETEVEHEILNLNPSVPEIEEDGNESVDPVAGAVSTITEENRATGTALTTALTRAWDNACIVWQFIKPRVLFMLPVISAGLGVIFLIDASLVVHDWRHVVTQCNDKYKNVTEGFGFGSAITLPDPDTHPCKVPFSFVAGGAIGICAGILQAINLKFVRCVKRWVFQQFFVFVLVLGALLILNANGGFSVQSSYDDFEVHKKWVQNFLSYTIFDSTFILISGVVVWICSPGLCSQEAMDDLAEEVENMNAEIQ